MYQKAFDFVSGYHCLLFIPLIHAQWDLWKQIEILKKSPFRDQSDFFFQLLLQLKPCTASNPFTFSVISFLGKLPGPTFPGCFLGFFPFGFLLASKMCKLHVYGLMTWISNSWLSRNSAVIWPSALSLYLAYSAFWSLSISPTSVGFSYYVWKSGGQAKLFCIYSIRLYFCHSYIF